MAAPNQLSRVRSRSAPDAPTPATPAVRSSSLNFLRPQRLSLGRAARAAPDHDAGPQSARAALAPHGFSLGRLSAAGLRSPGPRTAAAATTPRASSSSRASAPAPLSPFERIKAEASRNTAHGHPLILPSAYERHGPIFDVVALLHNAVKRQVLVAYDLVEAMKRNKYEVSHTEFELFFDWFDTFEDALLALLDIEQNEVYPFLAGVGVRLEDGLSEDARSATCAAIFDHLEKISEKRDMFRYLPAGEAVPRMSRLVNDLLTTVVGYCDRQNEELPQLINDAKISSENEVLLRVKFVTALRAKPNVSVTVPFLTHWLTERQLKAWKSTYLGPVIGLRYNEWARKFESSHQAIPGKIFEKLKVKRDVGEKTDVEASSTPSSTPSPTTPSSFFRRKTNKSARRSNIKTTN